MKQVLSFLTMGVDDLEKMKKFYNEVFGWKPIKDEHGIVFYKLNGFIFALYPASELAEDAGIPAEGSGFKKFTMAINLRSEAEVDQVFAEAENKGAKAIKRPEKVFWGGYRGYIADIENNYWEFAFNPFLELDSEGNVITHQ